jgi:hypothetical protein
MEISPSLKLPPTELLKTLSYFAYNGLILIFLIGLWVIISKLIKIGLKSSSSRLTEKMIILIAILSPGTMITLSFRPNPWFDSGWINCWIFISSFFLSFILGFLDHIILILTPDIMNDNKFIKIVVN